MTDRILRLPEVIKMAVIKSSTIYKHIALGTFPKQRKLVGNINGWLESEILEWIRNRPSANGEMEAE